MKRVITPMPEDLVAAADAEAQQQDRSRSWIIRKALAEYLAERRAEAVRDDDQARKHVEENYTDLRHAFKPQKGNALRCEECGHKKADHR